MFNLTTRPSFSPAGAPSARGVGTALRALAAASLALLAACGGGGGGDDTAMAVVGPPSVAAALANTTSEAQQSAPAAVAGADNALRRYSALEAFSAYAGTPLTPPAAAPGGHKVALAAPTMHPLAVQTAPCSELLSAPCTGSVSGDTNIAGDASSVRAGDWAWIEFQSLTGMLYGQQLSFNGNFRMDFLSAVTLGGSTFSGLDVKLSFTGFSGSINGASFGPVSEAFRLQVTSGGTSTITVGGASFTDLSGVSVTGSGSYTIGGGTLRISYWGDATRYVDLSYTDWQMVSGRPAVGAKVTATAGSDSIALTVLSSSTTTVVYSAAMTVAGRTTYYTVTATYAAGSDTATYVAEATRT